MSDTNYSDDEFENELSAKPMYSGREGGAPVRKNQRTESDEDEVRTGRPRPSSDASLESDDEQSASDRDEDLKERVQKLRIVNAALRKQLKEFARAVEASLAGQKTGSISGARRAAASEDGKKSLRAIVASKQKQVANLQKKLDLYRKNNAQLKRQIQQAYSSDRVLQMGNENKEKQREIDNLIQENRNLVAMQRSQAKKIVQQQANREEWPARLACLQDELRVTRETLRKYKEKARSADEEAIRQRELVIKLQEKNRNLRKEVERFENSNGKARPRLELDVEAQQAEWDKEREKLEHSVHVLEKSNKQERQKAALAAKKAEESLKEHQREVDKLQARVEEKEKDMRFQVLQIKKLKRGLRELALGDAPIALLDAPWSANMGRFLAGVDDDEDEEHSADAAPEQIDDVADLNARHVNTSQMQVGASKPLASPQPPANRLPANRGPRVARAKATGESSTSAEPIDGNRLAVDPAATMAGIGARDGAQDGTSMASEDAPNAAGVQLLASSASESVGKDASGLGTEGLPSSNPKVPSANADEWKAGEPDRAEGGEAAQAAEGDGSHQIEGEARLGAQASQVDEDGASGQGGETNGDNEAGEAVAQAVEDEEYAATHGKDEPRVGSERSDSAATAEKKSAFAKPSMGSKKKKKKMF